MIRFGIGILFSILLIACAGGKQDLRGGKSMALNDTTYAYRATTSTDTDFRYAQFSHDGKFEWKTLSLKIKNEAFYDGDTLVFLVDMEIENSGLRAFPWPDYSYYVALPDASGAWNYRLLFTQSDVKKISPSKKARYRYYTRLPGMGLPDKVVLVSQSFFGGSDTGFSFYLPD